MPVTNERLNSLIRDQKAAFLADFRKIVESPSVSSQADHKKDVETTARIAADFLRAAGAQAKIHPTAGNPVVFGRFENERNAPTVAVYNHLDVQPAEKGQDGWTRDPFVFAEEEGRFYGRGTTDDKGPAMTAFWAAKIARELKIPVNVEFIWEAEEEIGSPHFEQFLKEAKGEIRADSVVVSDTQWLAPGKPALTASLRGLLGAILRLRTATNDVHSGTCGGAARNPLAELADVIARCIDVRTGKITIPGVEKTWTPPSREELAEMVESGFTVSHFKAANKLLKIRSEKVEEVVSRIWASPTFEVHGIVGGYQGQGLKTIIPPAAEAKVTMRLVAGQDGQKVFECLKAYVAELNPDVEISREQFLPAYAARRDTAQVKAAAEAIEFGFGKRPVFIAEGGSIGAVLTMDRLLGKPVTFLGLSLPEDSYHGPDESFAWGQVEGGVRSFVKYFELLSSK